MPTNLGAPAQGGATQSSSSAPLSGAARYEKVEELGSGAFGVVELCKDKVTGEKVAIKYLKRGSKIDKYVEREILNHRELNHHHVIQFKEVFLTPQHLAIVMEYAPGGNMLKYVNDFCPYTMSERRARWFYQQIIMALDYCHKKGVALRDVKLENTLLMCKNDDPKTGKGPSIKLCDFGYSKRSERDSAPNTTVGTPVYYAPEVINSGDKRNYDGPAADVWSSGVMLYTMLVGCYPWIDIDELKLPNRDLLMFERILAVRYTMPRDLSVECKDLIRKILVADPAQRITIQHITQHPWFRESLPEGALEVNDKYLSRTAGAQDEESIKGIIQEARSLPEAKHRTPFHDLIEDEFNRLDIHSRDTIVHGNAHVVC